MDPTEGKDCPKPSPLERCCCCCSPREVTTNKLSCILRPQATLWSLMAHLACRQCVLPQHHSNTETVQSIYTRDLFVTYSGPSVSSLLSTSSCDGLVLGHPQTILMSPISWSLVFGRRGLGATSSVCSHGYHMFTVTTAAAF